MKVRIMTPAISSGGRAAFDAFREGCLAVGDDCEFTHDLFEPCDVAVHASGVKSGRLRDSQLSTDRSTLIQMHPKSRVVIESSVFREGRTDGEFWRVALNGFLRDEADYANENSDGDRFDWICEKQGIDVQDWDRSGDTVIVMLQKNTDASLRGVDVRNWARSMVDQIRAHAPEARIVVRPHPLDREPFVPPPGVELSRDLSPDGLKSDLERSFAAVTFTSLSAIETICAGIPTWAMDPGSLAYDVANHHLGRLHNPWLVDDGTKFQWLANLAWTQYTIPEIKEGIPWKRLKPRISAT